MKKQLLTLASMVIGAGLMYIFDPDIGKRRRAAVRNGMKNSVTKTTEAIKNGTRELKESAREVVSGIKHKFTAGSDEKLAVEIRDAITAVVTNPDSVEITVDNGFITLTGTLPEIELTPLIKSVVSVRGVRAVDNKIHTHRRDADKRPQALSAAAGG